MKTARLLDRPTGLLALMLGAQLALGGCAAPREAAPEPAPVAVSAPAPAPAPTPAAQPEQPPAPADDGSDWPAWRGPAGSGISPERAWTSGGRELWSRNVGAGYSQASVVGERLYTSGFYEARGVDATVCLDAETGAELWRQEHPAVNLDNMHKGGTLTTPTVADGRVYVLCRLGELFAFDAESGELDWSIDLEADHGIERGYFGLPSSPYRYKDLLLISVGPTLAFDPTDGELVWSSKDYGYSYATPTSFALDGRDHLAVFNGAGLTILDPADGSEQALHEWTSGYNVNCATPIVIGDRIFISTGYDDRGCAMLRLTPAGLELMWESVAMLNKMNGCVLVDDHLYGFHAQQLACMTLDGEVLWKRRGLGLGTVIAAGSPGEERLIVLSEDGQLLVGPASPAGFEPESEEQVLPAGPCWSTPVLSRGRIYVRNQAGTLVCRDHRAMP